MEPIFRFIEMVKNRLAKNPEKIKPENPLPVDTFCPVCQWSGNYSLTLIKDKTNDRCPNCGNSYLDYII